MVSDPELQKYYESLVDVFVTDGWQFVIEDMQEASDLVTLESCKNAEQFWIAKGKAEVFSRLLGYEQVIRDAFEALNVEDI